MVSGSELEEAVVKLLSGRERAEVGVEFFAEDGGLGGEVGRSVGANKVSAHEVAFESSVDLAVAREVLVVDRARRLVEPTSGVEAGVGIGVEGGVDAVLAGLDVVEADFFSASGFVVERVGGVHVGEVDLFEFGFVFGADGVVG